MKNLLNDARHEIRRLRRENEILRAKVETMDLFAVVLNTVPSYPPQGAVIDVAWQLDQEIERLEKEEAAPKPKPAARAW